MAEKIAYGNGGISNFEELVTLTLDRVILHTVVHHSSTSTYMPNITEIEGTFFAPTSEIHFITLRRVDLRIIRMMTAMEIDASMEPVRAAHMPPSAACAKT